MQCLLNITKAISIKNANSRLWLAWPLFPFLSWKDASIIQMKYRAAANISNVAGEIPLHIAAR